MGGAGPARRAVALSYCELTRREVEYLSLSRDTTDSELKQRREIADGSGVYIDQPAVRAALGGRVLLLDGIERAERNVLPLIHNLLENREMRLEDGRFLLSAERFDRLKTELSADTIRDMGLERVHEEFRVIALGLPVPPYRGHSLDPPLRSRFQARLITEPPFQELLDSITHALPDLPTSQIKSFLSVLYSLHRLNTTSESTNRESLPTANIDIPFHHVLPVLRDVQSGEISYNRALSYLLPLMEYDSKQRELVLSLSDRFKLQASKLETSHHTPGISPYLQAGAVLTQYHTGVLRELERLCTQGDIAVVGSRGCGKSLLVDILSHRVKRNTTDIFCYRDMTARDLLQQRVTDPLTGNTGWKNSPLVEAAIRGRIAVLDGLHRLEPGTLASLQSLITHRLASLPDGSRLIPADQYNRLIDREQLTEGVYPIHPQFRIIGISEPPAPTQATPNRWLGSESLSMFRVKSLPEMTHSTELSIIQTLYPALKGDLRLSQLLKLASSLRENRNDTTSQSLAQSLSTRQLLRLANRMAHDPNTSLVGLVKKACLYRFLTPLARNTLEEQLIRHNITEQTADTDTTISWSAKVTERDPQSAEELALIPDILFYDNKQQGRVLAEMLSDYMSGEHLLLVGNQGVGKNKLADRLLQRLSRPREYIQLHRDSSVQSLTTQPVLREGRLEYLDSPLVTAVKKGYTLVVDEADKAPLHVSSVLKGLVEGRGISLPDGRRVLPSKHSAGISSESVEQCIPVHPDFRMIVLANRPGFPFMGNNFFANMGDLFSTHAVDNPDFSSELSLVRNYAPSLSDDVINRLLAVMQELRSLADEGRLRYPYSTRESVAIAKHLALFPEEGLSNAVRNVFDFDSFDKDTQRLLVQVLHKHGIPFGSSPSNVKLAKHSPLPPARYFSTWSLSRDRETAQSLPTRPIRCSTPFPLNVSRYSLDRSYHRGQSFSEIVASWSLPTELGTELRDMKTADEYLHAITTEPVSLYSMKLAQQGAVHRDKPGLSEDAVLLSDLFYCYSSARRRRADIKLYPLTHPHSGQVVLFESASQSWLWIDPIKRSGRWIKTDTAVSAVAKRMGINTAEKDVNIVSSSEGNRIYAFSSGGCILSCLDLNSMLMHKQHYPFPINSLVQLSEKKWLATSDKRAFLCTHGDATESHFPSQIHPIEIPDIQLVTSALDIKCAHAQTDDSVQSPSQQLLFSNPSVYAGVSTCSTGENPLSTHDRPSTSPRPVSSAALPHHNLILNLLSHNEREATTLEAVDLLNHTLTEYTLHKPTPSHTRHTHRPYSGDTADYILATAPNSDDVILVDRFGHVLQLELAASSLERSLAAWREMAGVGAGDKLRVSRERFSGQDVKFPKHGRVDPDNAPHVGGNTWAGGTGGRDTAGLGGKGGPYRLDAGHDVSQLSDEEKSRVPEEITRAAREMGQKAFKERMREIDMSSHDSDLYQQYLRKVRQHIAALKATLTAMQNRGTERSWIRHQSTGELDDSKLVDSISGDRNVFVRRGEEEREVGAPDSESKLMRLLVDVSGSMYRFNSIDGRMERSMEAVLMVLEAFKGFEEKVQLEITGHSGDDSRVEFVSRNNVPGNENERLLVLKRMLAHSQFCWSGDNTLEATERAVRELSRQEGEQQYLVVLSDANFNRYGINAKEYGDILISEPRVNAFVIFIGSLGNQALRLKESLPAGKAYVCMDTKDIPDILKQIFASSLE